MNLYEAIEIYIPKITQKSNKKLKKVEDAIRLSITQYHNLKKKLMLKEDNWPMNIMNIRKRIRLLKNKLRLWKNINQTLLKKKIKLKVF